MTHCTCASVAPSAVCSAGSATFTTVPSMNAMLEPRMVAARIHAPLRVYKHRLPSILSNTALCSIRRISSDNTRYGRSDTFSFFLMCASAAWGQGSDELAMPGLARAVFAMPFSRSPRRQLRRHLDLQRAGASRRHRHALPGDHGHSRCRVQNAKRRHRHVDHRVQRNHLRRSHSNS